ncbi:MAG: hypothetical protein SCJ97_08365 [Bacillota bacterium]|nr:hypothetical protein [Bacillota bacterium]
MADNNERLLHDELIRKALHMECDCVDTPPADVMWQRIEKCLDKPRPAPKQLGFNWSRLAAVAAVFLVVVLGGLGLFRSLQTGIPAADSLIPPGEMEESVALHEEDDGGTVGIFAEESARNGVQDYSFLGEEDNLPPDRPVDLPFGLILGDQIILRNAGEPFFQAALYSSEQYEILWAEDDTENLDLVEFVKHLIGHTGRITGGSELITDEVNGKLYFESGDYNGIAWQEGNEHQALLSLNGFFEVDKFIFLAEAVK